MFPERTKREGPPLNDGYTILYGMKRWKKKKVRKQGSIPAILLWHPLPPSWTEIPETVSQNK